VRANLKIIFLAAVMATACGQRKTEPPAAAAPEVSVLTVHPQPVPIVTELPGRTNAYLIAQVRARVDGIVLKREFKEGSDIRVNQRLYQIDPAPYRAALASARASLQKAQANHAAQATLAERYKILLQGNGVSRQDYDNAVAALGQAAADIAASQAAVTTASINLGYTDVVAPISGRIGPSLVTPGAYVQGSAATPLAVIQQIDPIYVDLSQPSLDGLQLRRDIASGKVKLSGPGQAEVKLVLEDGSEYSAPGRLEFTDISVDTGTGTVTVRALFANKGHVLLPGMFVRARVSRGVDPNAIVVPQAAITHDPGGGAVAVIVGPDEKIARRTVQASRTLGDQWVIDSGLKDGDRVVVSGGQRTQPGMQVKVVEAAPSRVAAAR
jgi:membrane fusion protein (multidrug efflux system)